MDRDVLSVFDPRQNKYLQNGEVIRWYLQEDNRDLIGRIAAFGNKKYKNKGDKFPVGGIGFFDCIDDQPSANLLIDTAKSWMAQRGMIGKNLLKDIRYFPKKISPELGAVSLTC